MGHGLTLMNTDKYYLLASLKEKIVLLICVYP